MAENNKMTVTAGEIEFIRNLFPEGKGLTIKEIKKISEYSSYERNNTYLKSLSKKGAIEEKSVGKTLVYSIKPKNLFVKQAFVSYSIAKLTKLAEKHNILYNAINSLQEDKFDLIVLFGSYSKGTENKDSDVDLLCVTSDEKESELSIAEMKRLYGLNFHTILIPKKEFPKIKQENITLWNSLIKDGIIFKGYDLFYYYTYNEK
ncbi:MAG: nucleotidyltransferase domain-containing protein [Nanoarchaeota archaeon]